MRKSIKSLQKVPAAMTAEVRPSPTWRSVVFCATILCACLLAYHGISAFGYTNYDDDLYASANPFVNSGLSWPNALWAMTTFHAGNWHPLTWLSLMFDVSLLGSGAGPHHAVNLVLHLLNTALLFSIFALSTRRYGCVAAVAAIFALHPMHVESVAWIAGRKDLLSTLFWFLTFIFYIYYARSKGVGWYIASLLSFGLALTAKQMPVTTPLLLLLFDYWPMARLGTRPRFFEFGPGQAGRLIIEKIPFALLAFTAGIATIIAQTNAGAVLSLVRYPWWSRFANMFLSYAQYTKGFLFPVRLSPFYDHPGRDLPWGWALIAAAAVLVLSYYAIVKRSNRQWFVFGWAWFIVSLLPVIGLVQVGVQAYADRYTYVPFVGLSVAVVWAIDEALSRMCLSGRTGAAILVVAVIACFILTRRQSAHWKDGFSLYTYALAVNPNAYVANNNMGYLYMASGDLQRAEGYFRRAIQSAPDNTDPYTNLGILLMRRGDFAAAEAVFGSAVRISSGRHYRTLCGLAIALVEQRKVEQAAPYCKQASEAPNAEAAPLADLGVSLARAGANQLAVNCLKRCIKIDPANAVARATLQGIVPKPNGQ